MSEGRRAITTGCFRYSTALIEKGPRGIANVALLPTVHLARRWALSVARGEVGEPCCVRRSSVEGRLHCHGLCTPSALPDRRRQVPRNQGSGAGRDGGCRGSGTPAA